MASKLYDGTSAYKIDEYYDYAQRAEESKKKREEASKKRHSVNFKKLSVILTVVFAVALGFLYMNSVLIETSTKVADLNTELEDLKVRNTQVSFDIVSGVDYKVVEQKAISEYGMQHPESHQNIYVDVVQNDYVEIAKASENTGFIENLISGVQSFLAYIK